MSHTLAALYPTHTEAQAAVQGLLDAGHARSAISVVTPHDARHAHDDDGVSAGKGAAAGALGGIAGGVLASLGLAAIPGVGWVLAAGPIGSMIAAGAVGGAAGAVGGGLVGAMTDNGIDEKDAKIYAEAVRRGGTLVTVNVSESEGVRAASVLRRHGPVDIESTTARWRNEGWLDYDHSAQPLAGDALRTEREHFHASRAQGEDPTPPSRNGRYLRSYPYDRPTA